MTATVQARWAIELIGLGKSYRCGWWHPPQAAIEGITLRVQAGQVLGLLGPNGSGKSTVLKLLAGLLQPTAGTCLVGGFAAGSREARALIGHLPEQPQFPAHLSAREWLEFCAQLDGQPEKQAAETVRAMLAQHGLGAVADRRISGYSKGMRQRLGLAQALLSDPAIVLLDEPSSGLDPQGRLALGRTIRDLAAQGRTVVFSSHLLAQAEDWCDRVALLGRGRLLCEGAPAELLGAEKSPQAQPSRLEQLYLEAMRSHE